MESVFQRWVEAFGGAKKLADTLGVSITTVWFWLRRDGSPKVETMIELIRLSRGHLTFENIIRSTNPHYASGDGKSSGGRR